MEEESKQELRRAVRRLYLDAPDPPVHTAMVVARARPAPSSLNAAKQGAGGESDVGRETDRVIGTGADKRLAKVRRWWLYTGWR